MQCTPPRRPGILRVVALVEELGVEAPAVVAAGADPEPTPRMRAARLRYFEAERICELLGDERALPGAARRGPRRSLDDGEWMSPRAVGEAAGASRTVVVLLDQGVRARVADGAETAACYLEAWGGTPPSVEEREAELLDAAVKAHRLEVERWRRERLAEVRVAAWWRDWPLLRHLLIIEAHYQGRADVATDLQFRHV